MSMGFEKTRPKKLDLSGLPKGTPKISSEKERAAVERGETLGFVSRESEGPKEVRRNRKKAPTKSIFITGPAPVINQFIEYTNHLGVTSYWLALEKLLSK
jgi:hypothetical protein